MCYFLQAFTLSNSLSIAASSVCLPRSLGEVWGGSPLHGSGCVSACCYPRALAIPSAQQAPSPRCLLLPACPWRHPGKVSPRLAPRDEPNPPCSSLHSFPQLPCIHQNKGKRCLLLAAFLGYLFKRKMTYIDEKLASKHINQMPSITGLPALK